MTDALKDLAAKAKALKSGTRPAPKVVKRERTLTTKPKTELRAKGKAATAASHRKASAAEEKKQKQKPRKKRAAKLKKAAAAKKGSAVEAAPQAGQTSPGFRFPHGNKFWQCRAKHGRDGIWPNAEALLKDCLNYFEWLEENPLLEEKGFAYQGSVTRENFSKMRAATIFGLCTHLGVVMSTWQEYRKKPDFSAVCEYAESLIRDQKFTGAAADLLNANIIARDLGLKDGIEAEHSGKGGGPIELVERRIVRARNGDR